ncbi:zinc finger protein 250-like [Elgaria multicarinata webbii]|uniref:zinc finger protein 250-like n=1 Tax=Elgaria multicarinata webbii TaxID=159646 RepID=UPI002FCCE824
MGLNVVIVDPDFQETKKTEQFAGDAMKTKIKEEPIQPQEPSSEATETLARRPQETVSSSREVLSLGCLSFSSANNQKVFVKAEGQPGYPARGRSLGRAEQNGGSRGSRLMGEREEVWFGFGKTFRWKSYLIPRERPAPVAKLYQCSVCRKSYSTRSILATHGRIHTGEKPFRCSYCGRTFTQRVHAENHERVHTGERPYGCAKCGRTFGHRSSLAAHERSHATDGPLPCCVCGKTFDERASLTKHHRIHGPRNDCLCPKLSR